MAGYRPDAAAEGLLAGIQSIRGEWSAMHGKYGYAIVEGTEAYEVEFEYSNGEISQLTCTCFCSGNCKHEFAAMLQLRETLAILEENYAKHWESAHYFAVIDKTVFFSMAIDGKDRGSFTL